MMKGGMAGLMKQAQQMQERMQKMQEELASAETTGESGAGLVKVVMTGRHDVKRVSLDDSLLQEDKDILEDLIAAAVNDACARSSRPVRKRWPVSEPGCSCRPASKCLSDPCCPATAHSRVASRPGHPHLRPVNSGARAVLRLALHSV